MSGNISHHVSRVRTLYRKILQLHQALPVELKALGDQYVKDEFRRHKSVGPEEAQRFLQEWEIDGTYLENCRELLMLEGGISTRQALFMRHYGSSVNPYDRKSRTEPDMLHNNGQELNFCVDVLKSYAVMLWQQVNQNTHNLPDQPRFGSHLSEEKLNALRDEQLGQLKELMVEATKPKRQFDILDDSKYKS